MHRLGHRWCPQKCGFFLFFLLCAAKISSLRLYSNVAWCLCGIVGYTNDWWTLWLIVYKIPLLLHNPHAILCDFYLISHGFCMIFRIFHVSKRAWSMMWCNLWWLCTMHCIGNVQLNNSPKGSVPMGSNIARIHFTRLQWKKSTTDVMKLCNHMRTAQRSHDAERVSCDAMQFLWVVRIKSLERLHNISGAMQENPTCKQVLDRKSKFKAILEPTGLRDKDRW